MECAVDSVVGGVTVVRLSRFVAACCSTLFTLGGGCCPEEETADVVKFGMEEQVELCPDAGRKG
jgi:hypothetical protein